MQVTLGELGSSNAAFFFPLPAGGNIGDACPPPLKLPLCRSRRLREVYSMEDDDVDEAAAAAGPWPASTPGRAGLKRDLEGSFMREEEEEEERELKQTKSSAAVVDAPPRGGRSPSVAIGPCKGRRRSGLGLGLVVKWVRTKE